METYIDFLYIGIKVYCQIFLRQTATEVEINSTIEWLKRQGATEIDRYYNQSNTKRLNCEVIIFWHPSKEFYQKLWNHKPNPNKSKKIKVPPPKHPWTWFTDKIWNYQECDNIAICIPTNLHRASRYDLDPEALKLDPQIIKNLRENLSSDKLVNQIGRYKECTILGFTVKHHYQDKPDPDLIATSALELKKLNYQTIILPEMVDYPWSETLIAKVAAIIGEEEKYALRLTDSVEKSGTSTKKQIILTPLNYPNAIAI